MDDGSKTNYSKQIGTVNTHKNKCTLSAVLKEMEVGDICSCYVLNTKVAQKRSSEKPHLWTCTGYLSHNKLIIYVGGKAFSLGSFLTVSP